MSDLRSFLSGPCVVGLTGFFSPVVLGLSLYDENSADAALHLWAKSTLKVAGVNTVARGLEKLPRENFVLAVNHQSHFDALVLFRHIRRHLRFVAKRELAEVPVFGTALKKAGNVMVDRKGGQGDRQLLNDAIVAVRERVSICFFAEGTRSDDGVLKPFKKGAAVFAIQAGVPLVPAALAGTHAILSKGSLKVQAKPAALLIGAPIDTRALTIDDRDALTEQAHAQVAKMLEEGNQLIANM